jgi:transposase
MGMEDFSFKKIGKGRRNSQPYSFGFKQRIILEYLKGNSTLRKLGTKYRLNKGLIGYWVKIYKFGKPSGIKSRINKFKLLDSKKSPDLNSEEQIALLRRQLEDAQLKNVVLETMITVAEKQFKIPIRKKPGTKQSR